MTDQLEAIREEFRRALAYDKVVTATPATGKAPRPPPPDPRLEALAPYAKGEKLVLIRAERRTEILDALKIAADLKLKSRDLPAGPRPGRSADALKAAKVPVLVGGTLRAARPSRPTLTTPAYANPARLHEAGRELPRASKSGGSDVGTASRNLPYEAAMAVAFGLPEAAALRAVTLAPAEIAIRN